MPTTGPTEPSRWAFTVASPLGDARSAYELDDEELRFATDAPLQGGGGETLRWEAVGECGTASVDLPGGRQGPDLPRWVPGRMEWLWASRVDGKPFMRVLPRGPERDAVVARVRDRLGPRWIGEGLPLQQVQKRLGISARSEGVKVFGIVAGVLALLFALLLLLAVLAHPVFWIPAGFVLGGWLFRKGLVGLRDGLAVANTPTAKVASAALGLVELAGRAIAASPSPAGVSGRPSVWWDVAVEAWYESSDRGGRWRQIAARHGGTIDNVEIEDDSGRVPIWLKDADLLLEEETWEAGKHPLPPAGDRLLRSMGFGWGGNQRLRVRESRLEAGASMYVLGTLDESRRVVDGDGGLLGRAARAVRTGEWKGALVRRLPGPLGMIVAVFFGYLDMLTGIGRGGERVHRAEASPPPTLAPTAVVVWRGRDGHPFLVSNRPESLALAHLRKRSLLRLLFGIGVLCYCLYELVTLF
jgi:hypothetical protein